jgi:hypothetical protein
VKSRLLTGVAFTPAPIGPTTPAKGAKPIPAIGTMRRDATPEQRKAFAKMKRDMKRAARNVRYDQHLQEREARDKP